MELEGKIEHEIFNNGHSFSGIIKTKFKAKKKNPFKFYEEILNFKIAFDLYDSEENF